MAECIFCRIVGKEATAQIILETDNVISFLDIQPRSPGHSLVIPKRHASRLVELDDDTITGVFRATRDVVKGMQKALQPDAFNIGINDGEHAGQVVAHLHVNIIPRFRGDGGKAIHSVVDNPPKEEIGVTAERIRAAMQD